MHAILAREKIKIKAAPAILYALSSLIQNNMGVLIEWMQKGGVGTVEPLNNEMTYCIDTLVKESEKEINNFTTPQKFEDYGFTEKEITIRVNPTSFYMIILAVNFNRKILVDKIVIQDEGLDFSDQTNKCIDSLTQSAKDATVHYLREYNSQLN